MCIRVAIIYNEPSPSRYDAVGEQKAVLGVVSALEAVRQALVELGYEVICLPLVPPDEQARGKLMELEVDLVFNLFEGFCGYPETEAVLPEILTEFGLSFSGCPGAVLKLALDKAKVKEILKASGIRTPDFQLLNPQIIDMFRLNYPCIVKPCAEDASHGLSAKSLVNDFTALEEQVAIISHHYGGYALVEEFVAGREFNATVLGNLEYVVLPVSEIIYGLPPGMPEILTFSAKWETDSLYFRGTSVVCPANIKAKQQAEIAEIAGAAFQLLGCQGYARVDLRMDEEGRLNVIEVNPNPDISPGNGAARQAEAAGMSYIQFIQRIVELALEGKPRWESRFAPCLAKTNPA